MLRISPRSFLAWFWSLLFLTFFGVWIFPGCFPKKGALGKVGAAAGGGGAPLFGAPGRGPGRNQTRKKKTNWENMKKGSKKEGSKTMLETTGAKF